MKALRCNLIIKRNSQLYKLDLSLQDGLMRVGGQLGKICHAKGCKTSIPFCWGNYMLSQLRQRFRIPQANSAFRKLVSACTVCKTLQGRAGQQKMSNLPEDCFLPDKPSFINVGVDFFGHCDVKWGEKTVRKYGVLFTCFAIRAVHLEVADSLDTSSCINTLHRFISRRGQVTIMHSDNGTNFVIAEKNLREAIRNLKELHVEKAMQRMGIT